MAGRRKVNLDEDLSDNAIERAIKALENKGTKKTACQILNISYNVTRLDKLIENYKQKKEKDAQRRAEKRGKPATKEEISFVVTEYLAGAPVSGIASSLYRGTTFVNSILDQYSIPRRNHSPDYFNPQLIPDEAIKKDYALKETVYSAKYECLATIDAIRMQAEGPVYRIWLKSEEQQQFAYQPWWELASLDKLRAEGIIV